MANMSRAVGLGLMVLGILSYVLTDMVSPTALIPAGFGLVISLLGYYGRHEATRKTAMHLAMGVAMVGLLGSISGFASLPALFSGGDVARPAATISRSLMAIILLVYLAAGMKSFAAARRAR
jgi:hypothetical protein